MRFLSILSETCQQQSSSTALEFASLASKVVEPLVKTEFINHSNSIEAVQFGSSLLFPNPLPRRIYEHILCGYVNWLQAKYSLPEFVTVEQDDHVVDCGSFVGGFALSAAKIAEVIHVFEPDEQNFTLCSSNLAAYNNVILNNVGLYSNSQEVDFFVSSSSVDHSILTPDKGEVLEKRSIQVTSLFDYFSNCQNYRIDFLKLEAEGVEIEIFEGLKSIKPKKFAIDISPERDGISPYFEFKTKLAEMGYEVRRRKNVLFARKK